jgi:hypothetical protein
LKSVVLAAVGQAALPEKEAVHYRYVMALSQQRRSEHRAEVTCAACDEYFHI